MQATRFARRGTRAFAQFAFALTTVTGLGSAALAQGEVNIYSYRQPQLKAFAPGGQPVRAGVTWVAAENLMQSTFLADFWER